MAYLLEFELLIGVITESMKERKELLRKRYKVALAAITLASFYFAGIVGSLRAGKLSVSPSGAINGFFSNGVMIVPFIIFFCIFSAGALFIVYENWKASKLSDKLGRDVKYSEYKPYGSAHFEDPIEYRALAQIRPIAKCRGHILGQLSTDGSQCVDFFPDPNDPTAHVNQHIFASGASGSGKTYTIGKVYCYQSIKLGHSVIHSDPKGELYRDMANIYKKHGYIVRRLIFINPLISDGWDCMKTRRTDDRIQREINSDLFANAVISNIVNPGSDEIFKNGPKMLLKALILRLILDDSLSDAEKTIKAVYTHVSHPDGLDYLDRFFQAARGNPKLAPCLGPYSTFRMGSPNLLGNIITNLSAGLTLLSTNIIADMLSRDEMDLILPGKRPCAYFIQFPVGSGDTFKFPMALFFTMIFQSLMQYATACGGKLPVPVDFFLDEFPQLGVLPSWPEKMSVIRSYGLNVFMICQTLTQFRNNYRDGWETIISNCATWAMLGANDNASAEYFSERIGMASIEVETETRDLSKTALLGGRNVSDKASVGVGRNSLLSTEEILGMPPNTLIIIFQRHQPIWINTIPHVLHPYSENLPFEETDAIPFYDTEKRKQQYAKESKYIEEYWQKNSVPEFPADISDTDQFYRSYGSPFADLIDVIKEDISALFHKGQKSRKDTSEQSTPVKTKRPQLKKTAKKPVSNTSTDISPEPEAVPTPDPAKAVNIDIKEWNDLDFDWDIEDDDFLESKAEEHKEPDSAENTASEKPEVPQEDKKTAFGFTESSSSENQYFSSWIRSAKEKDDEDPPCMTEPLYEQASTTPEKPKKKASAPSRPVDPATQAHGDRHSSHRSALPTKSIPKQ